MRSVISSTIGLLVLLVALGGSMDASAASATDSATLTPSESNSGTTSASITPAETHSGTSSASITPAETHSGTASASITPAETHSGTASASRSVSDTASATITPAETATDSKSDSSSVSATATITSSASITPSKSNSGTSSASITPVETPSPSETLSHSDSASASQTESPSSSQSGTYSGDVAYPQNVIQYGPSTMSSQLPLTPMLFTGAAGGDKIFFVRLTTTDNVALTCEDDNYLNYAGTFSSKRNVTVGGGITLDPAADGMISGEYHCCIQYGPYKFHKKLANTGNFMLVGPMDSSKSHVCCDGPFLVGNRTYCYIHAVDSDGNLAGNEADECNMRINALTDGAGEPITNTTQRVEPTFIQLGRFDFWFTAHKSGCKGTVGVSYKGFPLSNKVAMFTLLPDKVHFERATSECTAVANQDPLCVVVQRDKFDNAVQRCEWDTNGDANCVTVEYTG